MHDSPSWRPIKTKIFAGQKRFLKTSFDTCFTGSWKSDDSQSTFLPGNRALVRTVVGTTCERGSSPHKPGNGVVRGFEDRRPKRLPDAPDAS